jgi:hypothetical protein
VKHWAVLLQDVYSGDLVAGDQRHLKQDHSLIGVKRHECVLRSDLRAVVESNLDSFRLAQFRDRFDHKTTVCEKLQVIVILQH